MRNDLKFQFDSQIIRWSYNKRVKRTFFSSMYSEANLTKSIVFATIGGCASLPLASAQSTVPDLFPLGDYR